MATQSENGDTVSLRSYLESLIREGDNRLERHVTGQILQVREQYQQVQIALIAADKLEMARLDALQREIQLQIAARDVAIDKAEVASEKRFESVNEFRAQMADQQATYLPREVFDSQHAEMANKVNSNTDRLNQMGGSTAGSQLIISYVIALIAIVVAIYAATHG